MPSLGEAMKARYPGESVGAIALREAVLASCQQFLDAGLGDRNAAKRLASTNHAVFYQQLTEVLLTRVLRDAGFQMEHQERGPDIRAVRGTTRILVEAICPTAVGVPPDWLLPPYGRKVVVHTYPQQELLLRWTAAIKEKSEKLLGNDDRNVGGYLRSGDVTRDEAYVIAVNGCLLRSGPFSSLLGISQLPLAVEATLGVGPQQVTFNRETGRATDAGHQFRPTIHRGSAASVPSAVFLDERNGPVSAVWAVDLNEGLLVGQNSQPMAVVHNPNATNPVDEGVLPSDVEYFGVSTKGTMELTSRVGRR